MKRLLVPLVFLLAAPAWAQQTPAAHAQAYAVAGPGRFAEDSIVYVAAGGEYIGRRGVGVAGELGRVSGARSFAAGEPARSTVVRGLYLILPLAKPGTTGRLHPFALAGLGFLTRNLGDSYYCYMFGGGANVDLTSHIGVRVEARRPIALTSGGGGMGALGVTFR